jgi:SPP1 gp7 family putative phage head morphogenesis protein
MRIDQLVSTADSILKNQEDKTVKSIQASLDLAFNKLEEKTSKLYEKALEDINTSSAFRLQKLITELGALLELIDPNKADFYRERLEKLILLGQQTGLQLSSDIIKRFETDFGSLSIRVDIEAAAFAAQNGMERLSNHTSAFRQEAIQIIGYNLSIGSGARKTASQLRAKFDLVKFKAEAIARTETLAALNEAADRTYRDQDVGYVQCFATADERTCKYCGYRNQRIYKRTDIKVPIHVMCRCKLTPIKPKWIETGLVDLEWSTKYHNEAGKEIIEKDSGVAPFERSAGLTKPPASVWNPGEKPPKLK